GVNGAVVLSHLCCNASEGLERSGTGYHVFLNRQHGDPPLRQGQSRLFVAKTHIGQREISNEIIIFRLLLEERFQFAARLAPTFLGGAMIASDILSPT